ncbi:hypothetical protein U9M48_022286 [Paspalum notatum var. saurae]|uniref:HAT C-terminal dimerisation domain-containing protein n=1 Tax=Paspalum notatum var. saurae TaxID=547442 RepID=A0AAQ3TJK2_PASNO
MCQQCGVQHTGCCVRTAIAYKEAIQTYADADLNYKWELQLNNGIYLLQLNQFLPPNLFYLHIVDVKIALRAAMVSNSLNLRRMSVATMEKFNKYWEETNNVMSYLSSTEANPSKSELLIYLDETNVSLADKEFDLLIWWKVNSHRFPWCRGWQLSFLTTPTTSMSSESNFSTGGRTLDDYRISLSPYMVEALEVSETKSGLALV